jgi:hypothetical protein
MSNNEIMEIFVPLTSYLIAGAPYVCFLVGLCCIALDRYDAFKLSRRKNIVISAKVTKSELFEYLSHDSDGSTTMYRPIIEYTYEINGKNYHSGRISHSAGLFSSGNKNQLSLFIKEYPIGKIVHAFANSENFEDVYLVEKIPGEWIVLAVGSIFILCGLAIIVIF